MGSELRTRFFLCYLLLSLFQNQAFAKIEAVLGPVPLNQNPNLAIALPQTSEPEILLSRSQYLISYNRQRRAPNYVEWELDASQIGHSGRTNAFAPDPDLEKFLSGSNQHAVIPEDYTGSCFDRGHQIPSADRSDIVANNETTFYMSNMIPQTPYLNRVIWEQLEQHTRQLVQLQNKKIFVIAGPIYDEDFGSIGRNADIKVPSKDFKIIFILDANQSAKDINSRTPMITVIMPNRLEDGSAPTANAAGCSDLSTLGTLTNQTWEKYQTSLDEIQRLSGLTISVP